MNKEQEQIIDEVYERYSITAGMSTQVVSLTRGWFLRQIKFNPKFSETWGLKIEERELSPKERIELAGGKIQDKYPALVEMSLIVCDERDIPTKLITITYKENKIESYE